MMCLVESKLWDENDEAVTEDEKFTDYVLRRWLKSRIKDVSLLRAEESVENIPRELGVGLGLGRSH